MLKCLLGLSPLDPKDKIEIMNDRKIMWRRSSPDQVELRKVLSEL